MPISSCWPRAVFVRSRARASKVAPDLAPSCSVARGRIDARERSSHCPHTAVRANFGRQFVNRTLAAVQSQPSSEVRGFMGANVSNYVFKPTAEEVLRFNHSPSRGGGLTRR